MLRDVDPFSDAFLEARDCRPDTLVTVVHLALAIAREGREGRKIGALFTVGDHQAVLARSRPLILDPLRGHPDAEKRIDDANVRETLKELAQLDGAFVLSDEGVAVAACRYLSASAEGIELPLGLGTRHMAAASITRGTRAVAVVVSESSMVRVFDEGEMVAEMVPEVWILRQAERRARDLEEHRAKQAEASDDASRASFRDTPGVAAIDRVGGDEQLAPPTARRDPAGGSSDEG